MWHDIVKHKPPQCNVSIGTHSKKLDSCYYIKMLMSLKTGLNIHWFLITRFFKTGYIKVRPYKLDINNTPYKLDLNTKP